MDTGSIINKVKNKKIIFFGEIHGTKEIPERIRDICDVLLIKGDKILYALELPVEIESKLNKFLKKEISEEELIKDKLLKDPISDGRFTPSLLKSIKYLSCDNAIFKCIDSLEGNVADRDGNMAKRLIKMVKMYPDHKIIVHLGNFHVSSKKVKFDGKTFKPLKLFMPRDLLNKSVTFVYNIKGSYFNQGLRKVIT